VASLTLRSAGYTHKACPVCGWRFFTFDGLDEHSAECRTQENGRRIAALNNTRRRRCDQCSLVSTVAGLGIHQKATGHTGWTEAA